MRGHKNTSFALLKKIHVIHLLLQGLKMSLLKAFQQKCTEILHAGEFHLLSKSFFKSGKEQDKQERQIVATYSCLTPYCNGKIQV